MNINGQNIAVNFFDTSGDNMFVEVRKEFYKDTQGVILMCDMSN